MLRQLAPELKEQQVDACEEFLRRYETEGDAILQHVVTGDERLGPLLSAINEEGKQRVAPHTAVHWKSDADSLLG